MDATSSASSLFRVGGLASGLDTDDIVSKLISIEQQPITRLENKKAEVTEKLTAWRDLNTRTLAMKFQSNALKQESTFQGRRASSSNTDVLTVTSTSGANTSSYSVSVESLARSHQVSSQSYGSSTAEIGTGQITINVGNVSYDPITVDSENNTLEGIRDTINDGNYGVSASIVQADTGDYRLILTGDKLGADNTIDVNMSLSGGTEPSFSTIQDARDAHIIMGEDAGAIDIYRSSNTIDDVIDGATLTLKSADAGNPVTLSFDQDTSSVKTQIQSFIDQYNNMVDYFDNQFFYDSETGESGTLFSDTTLLTIREDLYAAVTDLTSGSSGYNSLDDLGITINEGTGKLEISDESALADALNNDMENAMNFFTDEDNGLAVRVDNYLAQITDPVDGTIKITEDYFTEEIESLEESITVKEESLSRMEEQYYIKFAKLEAAMAEIQSQSEYIFSQLNAMSGSSSQSAKTGN